MDGSLAAHQHHKSLERRPFGSATVQTGFPAVCLSPRYLTNVFRSFLIEIKPRVARKIEMREINDLPFRTKRSSRRLRLVLPAALDPATYGACARDPSRPKSNPARPPPPFSFAYASPLLPRIAKRKSPAPAPLTRPPNRLANTNALAALRAHCGCKCGPVSSF